MSGRSMSKKRSVTLIEVLISMALFTLLLSALFFWYRHLTDKKGELEKLKRPYLEEAYMWKRLDRILSTSKLPFFIDDGLVFRFDRGPFGDPRLSNTVLGKLYYDPDHKMLCLGIWPDPLEGKEPLKAPSQTLTLLDHVDEIEFWFYSPPDPFFQPIDSKEAGKSRPRDGWQDNWQYAKLPALVKLFIKRGEREEELSFDLDQPILYPTETG